MPSVQLDMALFRPVVLLIIFGLLLASCGGEPGVQTPAGSPSTSAASATTSVPLLAAGELYGQIRARDLTPGADGVAVNDVIDGTNGFALSVYREVVGDTNLVIGNYSISGVLLLTMAGTAGETREEFARLLGVEGVDPLRLHPAVNAIDLVLEGRAGDGLQLNTANRLFVQNGLPVQADFLNVAVESYGAPAVAVDFTHIEEVAQLVNGWVAAETDGFIKELTQGYPLETALVLANAMYLKARWGVPFRLLEDPGSFTTLTGEVVSTPAMAHDDFLPSASGPDYTAVELPYVGGNLSLVVIQPADFLAFENGLTLSGLEEIFDRLEEGGIHLTMPIWSTETSLELLGPLHGLGLPTTYDFSTMIESGEDGYFIDSISHVARIEVDETGTTAGAATDVAIAVSHGPTVAIDRPFLYFVRDRGSGVILFMGRVIDPTASAG